ncbi:MAG TPA: hypothetical protein VFA88_02385 [Gaiellaceae bacterium]|nr:hypothetical protein [Gaiellaceae bacterium]
MTVVRPAPELDAEREVDLSRWRSSLVGRWWLVAAGLVAGAVIGGIVSISGGSVWQASVLLSPAQAFSPSGAPVLNYNSSPRGINDLVTSEATLAEVAAKTNIPIGQLRGNVTTQSIQTGAGTVAARGAVLIKIIVQLPHEQAAAEAANALGEVVKTETTSPYVRRSIGVLETSIAGNKRQLASLARLAAQLNASIAKATDPTLKLILVTTANNVALRQSTISNDLALEQQQLALATSVENPQLIGPPARATKTTAVSRRNAVLIGALIGLILGAIAAIAWDARASRV